MTRSKTLIAAATAAAMLAPAAASAREAHRGSATDQLSDPMTQTAVAAAMAAMSEAMLQMKVGPLARAAATMSGDEDPRDIDPDATLADMAGPEARRMPREMARKVPQMMGAMGSMAGAMEAMLPQLAQMGERMKAAMDGAAPRAGASDDDADPRPDYPGDADRKDEPAAGEATEE